MRLLFAIACVFALYVLLPDHARRQIEAVTDRSSDRSVGSRTWEGTLPTSGTLPLSGTSNDKNEVFASLPRNASLSNDADDLRLGVSPEKRATLIPNYVIVTGDHVNIRTEPSTSAKRLGSLPQGTKLILLEKGREWHRVSGQVSGQPVIGWMSSRYLSNVATPVISAPAPQPKRRTAAPTSREITAARNAIIRQSIAAYPGSCPCPFSRDRAGRRCGNRSAWSKPGGYSPICFDSDVSASRLSTYLARNRMSSR